MLWIESRAWWRLFAFVGGSWQLAVAAAVALLSFLDLRWLHMSVLRTVHCAPSKDWVLVCWKRECALQLPRLFL